jgi:hypothetical protein
MTMRGMRCASNRGRLDIESLSGRHVKEHIRTIGEG